MPKAEIQNEAIKYTSYRSTTESISSELDAMRNSVNDNFQGRAQDEMSESINLLRNMTNDLSGELSQMQTSLNYLHEDVVQEQRRQERIRREKEEEARRKAEAEKNK